MQLFPSWLRRGLGQTEEEIERAELAAFVPGRRRFLFFSGAALAGTMVGGIKFSPTNAGLLAPSEPMVAAPLAELSGKTLITPQWVAREIARGYANSLKSMGVALDYASEFREMGARVGDTVQVRKPPTFKVDSGFVSIVDATRPKVLTDQYGVAIPKPASGMTTDQYRERYIQPAAESLARSAAGHTFTADLPMPHGGARAHRVSSSEEGVSVRLVEQYSLQTDEHLFRADVIVGRS